MYWSLSLGKEVSALTQRGSMKTIVLIFLLSCVPVMAAYAEVDENKKVYVDFQGKFIPDSDLKDQPGKLQVSEFQVDIGYKFRTSQNIPIDISIGPKHYVLVGDNLDLPSQAKARGIKLKTELPIPFLDEKYKFGIKLNPT